MPIRNVSRRRRLQCSFVLLPLLSTVLLAAQTKAAETVTRACDDMSFKSIAQMMDTASAFATRLVLLGKSLVQDRGTQLPEANEGGATASEMEEINVGALRNSLGEVWGYLLASENLAAVRDLTLDERDRASVDRQLKLVAQQIQEPLSFGLESAENVAAKTKRPAIAAEVAKIREFMDDTRTQFSACAGRSSH